LGEQDKRDGAKGRSSRSAGGRSRDDSGRKADRKAGNSGGRPGAGKLSGSNVGRVLRTAYDDALREAVPDEFLNLLGKLD
jgi:hypothetical protein